MGLLSMTLIEEMCSSDCLSSYRMIFVAHLCTVSMSSSMVIKFRANNAKCS